MSITAWDWFGLWMIIAAIILSVFNIYRKLHWLKEMMDLQQEMIDLLHEREDER